MGESVLRVSEEMPWRFSVARYTSASHLYIACELQSVTSGFAASVLLKVPSPN